MEGKEGISVHTGLGQHKQILNLRIRPAVQKEKQLVLVMEESGTFSTTLVGVSHFDLETSSEGHLHTACTCGRLETIYR